MASSDTSSDESGTFASFEQLASENKDSNRSEPSSLTRAAFEWSDFIFGRELHTGRFASVCKAVTSNNKPVALKIVDKAGLSEDRKESLKREVEIQSRISHKNVCALYACFQDHHSVALVLEYCNGLSLQSFLSSSSTLSVKELQTCVRDVACGLRCVHAVHGVIHRDVKPENVLVKLCKNGSVVYKLADFGCALKIRDAKQRLDSSTDDSAVGTTEYLAPELTNSQRYDDRVDAWALGVLTFEVCTGTSPFRGLNEVRTLDNIARVRYDRSLLPLNEILLVDFVDSLLCECDNRCSVSEISTHPFLTT